MCVHFHIIYYCPLKCISSVTQGAFLHFLKEWRSVGPYLVNTGFFCFAWTECRSRICRVCCILCSDTHSVDRRGALIFMVLEQSTMIKASAPPPMLIFHSFAMQTCHSKLLRLCLVPVRAEVFHMGDAVRSLETGTHIKTEFATESSFRCMRKIQFQWQVHEEIELQLFLGTKIII